MSKQNQKSQVEETLNTIEYLIARELNGEILTLIDAAIANERQNKALKDQVKQRISRKVMDIHNMLLDEDDNTIQSPNKAVPSSE